MPVARPAMSSHAPPISARGEGDGGEAVLAAAHAQGQPGTGPQRDEHEPHHHRRGRRRRPPPDPPRPAPRRPVPPGSSTQGAAAAGSTPMAGRAAPPPFAPSCWDGSRSTWCPSGARGRGRAVPRRRGQHHSALSASARAQVGGAAVPGRRPRPAPRPRRTTGRAKTGDRHAHLDEGVDAVGQHPPQETAGDETDEQPDEAPGQRDDRGLPGQRRRGLAGGEPERPGDPDVAAAPAEGDQQTMGQPGNAQPREQHGEDHRHGPDVGEVADDRRGQDRLDLRRAVGRGQVVEARPDLLDRRAFGNVDDEARRGWAGTRPGPRPADRCGRGPRS